MHLLHGSHYCKYMQCIQYNLYENCHGRTCALGRAYVYGSWNQGRARWNLIVLVPWA